MQIARPGLVVLASSVGLALAWGLKSVPATAQSSPSAPPAAVPAAALPVAQPAATPASTTPAATTPAAGQPTVEKPAATSTKKGSKKHDSSKTGSKKGRLPPHYSAVVTHEQREKMYGIAAQYAPKLAALRAELATVLKEETDKLDALLTPEQKHTLEQFKATTGAKTRGTHKRSAAADMPSASQPAPAPSTPSATKPADTKPADTKPADTK